MSITVSFILTPFSSISGQRKSLVRGGAAEENSARSEQQLTVADGLDLDGFGDPLLRVGLCRLPAHLGLEQGVHQCGLAKTALA